MKILIPEIVPAHNKGEEAIMRGIQTTLEDLPINAIYLYSIQGEYDQEKYGDPVKVISDSLVPYSRLPKISKFKHIFWHIPLHVIYAVIRKINKNFAAFLFHKGIYKIYNEIDFVLAAHDNAYAIMHNALILFCRFVGIPVIIYATSIKSYVYERKFVRIFTRYALSRADLVTTRERLSYDVIREKVGAKGAHIRETGDLAFLVKPEQRQVALSIFRKHDILCGKDTVIGMTVVHKTDVFLNCLKRIDDIDKKLEAHWSILADFIDYVVESTGAKIVFFPHSIGPDEKSDDRIAARGLYARAKEKKNIILIEEDYSVRVLKSMIGCCDFFVTERTHACIGAASTCTPFLGLTYEKDYRTHGILGKAVAMEQWLYDLDNLSLDSLCRIFDRAWEAKGETMTHLKNKIPLVVENAMLNKKYLMETLAKMRSVPDNTKNKVGAI